MILTHSLKSIKTNNSSLELSREPFQEHLTVVTQRIKVFVPLIVLKVHQIIPFVLNRVNDRLTFLLADERLLNYLVIRLLPVNRVPSIVQLKHLPEHSLDIPSLRLIYFTQCFHVVVVCLDMLKLSTAVEQKNVRLVYVIDRVNYVIFSA